MAASKVASSVHKHTADWNQNYSLAGAIISQSIEKSWRTFCLIGPRTNKRKHVFETVFFLSHTLTNAMWMQFKKKVQYDFYIATYTMTQLLVIYAFRINVRLIKCCARVFFICLRLSRHYFTRFNRRRQRLVLTQSTWPFYKEKFSFENSHDSIDLRFKVLYGN